MQARPPSLLAAFAVTTVLVAGGVAQAQSRASLLHDALHLTAEQEPGWRTFQASAAPDPMAQAQARASAQLAPTLPTPRRLALIRAQMQADLSAFDRTSRAVETFYAALTPQQQAAFDKQTADAAGARRP